MPYRWPEPRGEEDPLHRRLRCPETDFHRAMRHAFEDVFSVFEPLATRQWFAEVPLPGKTLARFWEAYVGAALLDAGLQVGPESKGQPDFRVTLPTGASLWVECVTPTLGDPRQSENAIIPPPPPSPGCPTLYVLPVEALLARVAQAVDGKYRCLQRWRGCGVAPDHHIVIAVNEVRLTDAFGYGRLGYVLEAAYGIGNQVLLLDPTSNVARDGGWESRLEARKANDSTVPLGWFRSSDYAPFSAFLVGSVGPHQNSQLRLSPFGEAHAPQPLGSGLALLHNPLAAVPLPQGVIPCAWEWTQQGDVLKGEAGRSRATWAIE